MEVLAHARQFPHRGNEPRRHVPGMRAREPYATHAGNGIHRGEQAREVTGRVVRRLVVVHNLPEQVNFGPTAVDRLLNLCQHF